MSERLSDAMPLPSLSELGALVEDGTAVRALFDACSDLVTVSAVHGPPTYVNPAARRAFGLAPEETVDSLLDFRAPGFRRYLADVILPAVRANGVWRGVTDYVSRSGQTIRVSQVTVATDREGVTGFLTLSRDISEQQRAQDELRQAEQRMRFALEAAGAGVWEADLRTGQVVWSDTMRTIQGLSIDEPPGTLESFLALIHPEDQPEVRRALEEAISRARDFRIQFRILWPDGSTRSIESSGRVMRGGAGQSTRLLAMAQDVTERTALEAHVRNAQRIEAIGQLAGGLAHDFNNLLTAILGYARILEEDLGEQDPRRPDVAEIRCAGERAAQLTRQLLAFSRRQTLQPSTFDLTELIRGIARMLTRLVGEHIDVELALHGEPVYIEADHAQIEQVLVNLAVNARDAMDEGGRLTIATGITTLDDREAGDLDLPPGPYAQLLVGDTGIGMEPATQERIFEPFFTTKPRGKGTGLGLAAVFGIVHQSGGSITVDSTPGTGTRFRLVFPLAALPSSRDEPPAVLEPPVSNGRETILLVEDEDAVRRVTGTILLRAGYKVIAAPDPEAAMRLAATTAHVDLVLSDVMMPGLVGPELVRRIRESRPGLRALFMSGFAEDVVTRQGVDIPAGGFLRKPFMPADLLVRVREALDVGSETGQVYVR